MTAIGELLDAAVRYHQVSDLEQAERLYQEIIRSNSHHADAHHLLGLLRHQTGHNDEAVALIRRAIDLNPSAAVFHFNLGTILKDARQWIDAAECYRRALS